MTNGNRVEILENHVKHLKLQEEAILRRLAILEEWQHRVKEAAIQIT